MFQYPHMHLLFANCKILSTRLLVLTIFAFFFECSAQKFELNKAIQEADSLFKDGLYTKALEKNMQILNFVKKYNNCKDLAIAYMRIGRIYYYLFRKPQSIHYFKLSINKCLECNLDSFLAVNYRNLGAIYTEKNYVDSARYFLTSSKNILLKNKSYGDLSTCYAIISAFYLHTLPDKNKCKLALDTSYMYALKDGSNSILAFYHMKRGGYYREFKAYTAARDHYSKALKYYEKENAVEGLMYANEQLAFIYKQLGNADSCFSCFDRFKFLRDSVYSKKTADEMAKYETTFKMHEKELENVKLNYRNRVVLISSIAGLIVIIGIFLYVYQKHALKNKQKFQEEMNAIEKKNIEVLIESQEMERKRIAGDLHDGAGHLLSALKLNLTSINVADKNERKIHQNAIHILDEVATEVRDISHLLMPQTLSDIGLIASIMDLCTKINVSKKILIQFNYTIEESSLTAFQKLSIFRIIQEILNNILKHANAQNIMLNLSKKDRNFELQLIDDGRNFNMEDLNNSKGLGWKNIMTRISLLNGKIAINNTTNTEITISIPFRNEQ